MRDHFAVAGENGSPWHYKAVSSEPAIFLELKTLETPRSKFGLMRRLISDAVEAVYQFAVLFINDPALYLQSRGHLATVYGELFGQ